MPSQRARTPQHTPQTNIREGCHHLLPPAQSSWREQNITPMEALTGKQAQCQRQLRCSPHFHRDNLLPLTSSVASPANTMIRCLSPLPPAAVNHPCCPPPSSCPPPPLSLIPSPQELHDSTTSNNHCHLQRQLSSCSILISSSIQ